MYASCPQQKFHSSSQFPLLLLSSLESFSVLFLLAKPDECAAIVIQLLINPLSHTIQIQFFLTNFHIFL